MTVSFRALAGSAVLAGLLTFIAGSGLAAPRLIVDGVPYAELNPNQPSFIDQNGDLRVSTVAGASLPQVTLTRTGSGSVASGSSVQINWVVSGATSCTPTNGTAAWRNTQVTGTGSASFVVTSTTLFELVCSNASGQRYAFVEVPVTAPMGPPAVSVSGPSSVLVNGSASINWSVSNVPDGSVCQFSSSPVNSSWNSQVVSTVGGSASGTRNLTLSTLGNNSFTLTCNVPAQPVASSTHTVNVTQTQQASISSFTLNNTAGNITVSSGSSVVVSAAFSNATGCTLTTTPSANVTVSGSPAWSGQVSTSPVQRTLTVNNSSTTNNGTVQFTINCEPGGVSMSRTVTVSAQQSALCQAVQIPAGRDTTRTTLASVFGPSAQWGSAATASSQFFTVGQWVGLEFVPNVAPGRLTWSVGSDNSGQFEVRISRCLGDFRSPSAGPPDEQFCTQETPSANGLIIGDIVGSGWCPIRPGETHYINIRMVSCPVGTCQFYGNLRLR